MEQLTQSRSDNCWQTCIAMLLGRPATSLPLQHKFEKRDDYGKALRVFLDKHHGVTYVEIGPEEFDRAPREHLRFHLIIGESPRSSPTNDTWHAIVGSFGVPHWDVNPSRAGLTKICAWGLLVPTPAEWRAQWSSDACVCASCLEESSNKVAACG